ncbi:NUDIX hydrolase [Nocardia camponoti]|uniref:NUDIX hydrolase n=1 Tax=Nocardia camponoti TaxID=1616106 RepID=UPI001666A0C5|nr:NUDIX domain-containing protein [Nocardia camponoti]
MEDAKYRSLVGVHLVLIDERGRVLLGRRVNTGFGDGLFHVPAGHLEAGESVIDGLIREANEEIGIEIPCEAFEFVHVMHSGAKDGRVQMFFRTRHWNGHVTNREPDKCSELRWFDPQNLPTDIVDYCRQALAAITAGEAFSLYGWDES